MKSPWLIFEKSDTLSLIQLHIRMAVKMFFTIYINFSTLLPLKILVLVILIIY